MLSDDETSAADDSADAGRKGGTSVRRAPVCWRSLVRMRGRAARRWPRRAPLPRPSPPPPLAAYHLWETSGTSLAVGNTAQPP